MCTLIEIKFENIVFKNSSFLFLCTFDDYLCFFSIEITLKTGRLLKNQILL